MAAAVASLMLVGAVPAHAAGSLAPPACGPKDNPTGVADVDGQVSLADRASGRWMTSYTCNLELVGQDTGEGASWQNASYDHCDYYDTAGNSNQAHLGTRVEDVSDPAHPKTTEILSTPAMNDPWESLKVNHRRGLLAGVQNGGEGFSVYDVKSDCAHPKSLANIETTTTEGTGHAGAWAPDGRTYYGTTVGDGYAIDTSDPSHPKDFYRWTTAEGLQLHDLGISDDGTRGYVGAIGRIAGADTPASTANDNGLQIIDLSPVQNRASRLPDAPAVVGKVYWRDGGVAQEAFPVLIGGKQFVVFTDEMGPYGIEDEEGRARACGQGIPPFGMARLIDVSDETHPKVVSKLMLQVNDPDNCETTIHDNAAEAVFSYDSHYCNVDDLHDVHYLACGQFQSGIRVYDVSDPAHPREVAYYIPPAQLTPPGSNFNGLGPKQGIGEWAPSKPQFHNGNELWVSTMNNGFQVLRFTNGIRFGHASDEDLAQVPAGAPASTRPACVRSVLLRLARKHQRVRDVRISVNGRRVRTLRGRRAHGTFVLRRLPHGAARVKVVIRPRKGRPIVKTIAVRGC